MNMTRRDWWVGVALLTAALVFHAVFPRYQWQHTAGAVWLRVDRWTGSAERVIVTQSLGTRFPLR